MLPISCADNFKPNLFAAPIRPPVMFPKSSKVARLVSKSSSLLMVASLPANLDPLSYVNLLGPLSILEVGLPKTL